MFITRSAYRALKYNVRLHTCPFLVFIVLIRVFDGNDGCDHRTDVRQTTNALNIEIMCLCIILDGWMAQ